jgi:hypothetical protein
MLTIDAKADCNTDVDRSWNYNTSNTQMVWTFKNKSDKTIMYSGIGLKTKDDKIMYEKKTKEYLAPYSILRIEVYVGNLNLDVAGKGFTRCEYQEKPKLEEWITGYKKQVSAYSVGMFEQYGIFPRECEIWISCETGEVQTFTLNLEDIKYWFGEFQKDVVTYHNMFQNV